MKVVVADTNLVSHRERLDAAVPSGMRVSWHAGGVPSDELRDADVYVGSRFTADMADAAEKLRLIHSPGRAPTRSSSRRWGQTFWWPTRFTTSGPSRNTW